MNPETLAAMKIEYDRMLAEIIKSMAQSMSSSVGLVCMVIYLQLGLGYS